MRRNIMVLGGILAVVLGTIFLLQGLGIIRAPADSFMIDNRTWVWRGGILAGVGVILALAGRLTPDRKRKGEE
ncbi:hypothetical protein ACFQ1E_17105 [Sphingomonas canadensis]|uniref:DUF3185 family protein n=1 Tax=Sphingomonas canadensis TaxID=1219257 RepID=A0ABW3H9B8_9SPHN|nr:hypothetical protein [Sphingomonas canadensis]MCW3837766.1 hypothetical protein [Sphingomonas canadensis]